MTLARAYGALPLAFEANRGQAPEGIGFVARGGGYSISLRPTEALFALGKRDRLSMELSGASKRATPLAEQPLPGTVNYLVGNDRSKWLTGIPTYARITFRNVYPGIDVAYHGRQGRLEYDLLVHPGASPDVISLRFAGAKAIRVEPNGSLSLNLGGGTLRQLAPRVYQQVDGKRRWVEGRFLLRGQRVSFALGAYDRSRTLVIDPVLAYSTYLGGTGDDFGFGSAVDAGGSAYLTGYTLSTDFPTASPLQANAGGSYDAFATKLNAAGTALVYSTYLGGSNNDYGYAITVDEGGSAYVSGYTDSTNFPTASALQATKAGSSDAFVAKLNAAGTALVYSTYLGGSGSDLGYGIAVGTGGSVYLTGQTTSTNFPTASALQATNAGQSDAFVAKLNASGTALVYSTYLGGSVSDYGHGIAVDATGSAYLTGYTESTDFPTANALQAENAGSGVHPGHDYDAFVAKLNAVGTALVYSTYVGGSAYDEGRGIAVDAGGSAYLTGYTLSTDFPTASALQATKAGSSDAFVAKLNGAGTALVYSTYLGGSNNDYGYGIAVGTGGSVYLTGQTTSTDFPTANALQATNAGEVDAFVAKLNAAGTALVYSTYLGGSSFDEGRRIAVDASGSAYLAGSTFSTNFPTASSLRATNAGGSEAFVAKISDQTPTAVSVRSLVASRSGRLVVLRWRTVSELSLFGFYVYREQSGMLVKLNRTLITSVFGGTSRGHAYSWLDRSAPKGKATYRLQAVNLSAQRSWVGAAVVVN